MNLIYLKIKKKGESFELYTIRPKNQNKEKKKKKTGDTKTTLLGSVNLSTNEQKGTNKSSKREIETRD